MKTPSKIRLTFSDRTLNITIPRGWHELSEQELRMIYKFLTVYEPDVAPIAIFCNLANAKLKREVDGKHLVVFRVSRKLNVTVLLSPDQMVSYISHLDWLADPGNIPVRLSRIGGNKAVDAYLHGVPFGDYLRIESLYQAYLQSQTPAVLVRLANILYKGKHHITHLDDADSINIFNWVAQIKSYFSAEFPHFFRPAEGGSEEPKMVEIMNAQIRALTGGDVAKEDQILAIDCWRALTELDAKAREADEFNKQMKKK